MSRCGTALPFVIVISLGTLMLAGTQLWNWPSSPTSANWTSEELLYSPVLRPCPASGTPALGREVVAVVNESVPVTPPGTAGRNVTGIPISSPRCRTTGRLTGELVWLPARVMAACPEVNWAALDGRLDVVVGAVTPVTVTSVEAVAVTFWVVERPTLVGLNAAGGAAGEGRLA